MHTENTFWLTLRIYGKLPSREEIERLMKVPLHSLKRKDPTSGGKLAVGDVATIHSCSMGW
jgi:hypothetical protein